MAKLFFSYSHKDEDLRDELETHLAMLKRQELVDAVHDRRITAPELALSMERGRSIGQELSQSIQLSRDRGMSR